MQINRYTDITPSNFQPLSLQEIMLAPSMQRQKHDQLLAQQELLKQGLVKVDPLNVHMDEALSLRNNIESELSSQAELLSKEGINPNTQAKFLALNTKYNNLMSPTGRLGQINAAKQVYQKQMSDYLEDATKTKGWSREQALRNWQNKVDKPYTGFDANRNIVNISPYGAPKRIDTLEELKKVKDLLGDQVIREIGNDKFSLRPQADGSVVVVDGSGRRIETSNKPNLENALKLLNQRMSNPEWRSSMEFEGVRPEQVNNEIIYGINSMLKTDVKDNRDTNYSLQGYENAKKDQDPSGMIISNDSTIASNAIGVTSFSGAKREIGKLSNSKSLNPADRAKLDDLQELKAQAEVKMLKDPEYNKALKEYNNAKNRLNSNDYPKNRGAEGERSIREAALNRTKSKLESIQDKYWKESSATRHNYSYLPSNPKEESVWNLHNENVFNTLKGIGNLGNVLDLTSIHTTGGTKKNMTPKDVDNIQELIKNGDSKSFKINNIKTYGDNKTPEITMTFNTLKGAKEYDTEGLAWNDEYGGEEKPVTVTFKLKRLSNAGDTGSAAGFKNLTGAIAGFYKDKGGVNEITGNHQGAEVYSSIIENAYKDISNEELYQRAQVDSDAREAFMIRVAKRQKNK